MQAIALGHLQSLAAVTERRSPTRRVGFFVGRLKIGRRCSRRVGDRRSEHLPQRACRLAQAFPQCGGETLLPAVPRSLPAAGLAPRAVRRRPAHSRAGAPIRR
ncbi:MAG: hypothetical protein EBS05_07105 [Proteobacteria bacterium]|nr:hypothetical protein [Pseudomonadota bacterium]